MLTADPRELSLGLVLVSLEHFLVRRSISCFARSISSSAELMNFHLTPQRMRSHANRNGISVLMLQTFEFVPNRRPKTFHDMFFFTERRVSRSFWEFDFAWHRFTRSDAIGISLAAGFNLCTASYFVFLNTQWMKVMESEWKGNGTWMESLKWMASE